MLGTVVLDEAVGLEHIRADLAAPGDVLLGLLEFLLLFLPLAALQIIEAARKTFMANSRLRCWERSL